MRSKRLRIMIFAVIIASMNLLSLKELKSQEQTLSSSMKAMGYYEVRMVKNMQNEYEVTAKLNDKTEITLIINLQSALTMTNKERMEKIDDLDIFKTKQELNWDGDEFDVYGARIKNISIREAKTGPMEIRIMDFDDMPGLDDYRVDGVIGREFLTKYKAVIDFSENKLYLKI